MNGVIGAVESHFPITQLEYRQGHILQNLRARCKTDCGDVGD